MQLQEIIERSHVLSTEFPPIVTSYKTIRLSKLGYLH